MTTALLAGEELDDISFIISDGSFVDDEICWVVQDNQNIVHWDDDEGEPSKGAYWHQR